MASLKKQELETLFPHWKTFDVFIETGTNKGHTTFEMSPHFKKVHTIELSPVLHSKAVEESQSLGLGNITFHLGDSVDILPTLLESIDEKAIFFLDGHWSGDDTARGPKDCPLIEELGFINKLHNFPSLIIIDDLRLFGTNYNEDWSEITLKAINDCFSSDKISKHGTAGDRYFIFLND